MGKRDSLVLVDSPPRDGVSIKILVVVTYITTELIMSVNELNRKSKTT